MPATLECSPSPHTNAGAAGQHLEHGRNRGRAALQRRVNPIKRIRALAPVVALRFRIGLTTPRRVAHPWRFLCAPFPLRVPHPCVFCKSGRQCCLRHPIGYARHPRMPPVPYTNAGAVGQHLEHGRNRGRAALQRRVNPSKWMWALAPVARNAARPTTPSNLPRPAPHPLF